jgi:RimJ/RimL family protein N-acetyltransferase
MTDFEIKAINDITVETVSKAIINETSKWGFRQTDYISLVNAILDLSLIKYPAAKPKADLTPSMEKFTLPIIGENIQIRLFNKTIDYKITKKWLEDDFGRWFLLSRPHTKEITFDQLIEDKENILGIIMLPDESPIGLLGFLDCNKENLKAEMRKLIGEVEYREKGYAKEATNLWIKYGINNLGFKKIYLNTVENNIRNITLNMELGFKVEGILRKECFVDNEFYDILRMGLIVE